MRNDCPLNNDAYLQPDEPDTTTYSIDLVVKVTYTYNIEIDAASEEEARYYVEQDSRNLIEQTVLNGEKEEIEFEIDYLSDGRH